MTWIPRSAVMVLLAVGALVVGGCTSSESGSPVVGPAGASSSAIASDTPASRSTASQTTASSSTAGRSPTSTTSPGAPRTSPSSTTSSSTTSGRATARPATTAPTTPTTATGSTSIPPSTVSRTPTSSSFPICPGVATTDATRIVSCLRTSVSNFWSGRLNQVVDQDVIVDPTVSQVPESCHGGLTGSPAFTCQINDTVYINQGFLDQVTHSFGSDDIPYALASVVSHEIGHVVQAAVKQPGYDKTGTSHTISLQIEQQADCLSGVWASSQVKVALLDAAVFQTVSKQLITDVSSNPEIYTHGTPDQRAAAIAQGLSAGTPQGCKLNTFS